MNAFHERPALDRPSDAVLAKVRKILAKAEDPAATREEAETYTAKAADLIAAYGIDRALLAQNVPGSDVVGDRVVVLDAPYALDKANLLSGVAVSLRCQAVQRTRYDAGSKELSMHLFGYDSDLARAEVLYTSLLLQATSSLARAFVPPGEHVAAYRRSWLAGFTAAVVRRLQEIEQRAADAAEDSGGRSSDGRSVALVLADRSSMVRRAMEDAYPGLRKAQARSLSGSGGRSGYLAGERADLGGTRVERAVRGQVGTR
ncbi:MAG TPA: DUF2786 domain-containing protein [Nocardioidaceae bacterium]|nr:DUF2786 domain-containing protein [Nocardioidaceae bacterium]